MFDCAWIYRNMLDYVRVSVNMPKSAWIAFVDVSILIACLLEHTYFNEVYSLKEQEPVFLKRQNLVFSLVVAGSILFASWF